MFCSDALVRAAQKSVKYVLVSVESRTASVSALSKYKSPCASSHTVMKESAYGLKGGSRNVLLAVLWKERFKVLGMTADDFRVCIKAVINMVGDCVGKLFIIPAGDILPERFMLVIERKKP